MTDDPYTTVCELLRLGHSKDGEGAEVTLNRVFQKSVRLTEKRERPLPVLSRANVEVHLDDRKVGRLHKLSHRRPRDLSHSPYPPGATKRHKRRVRKSKDIPVIVVRFEGREYLLDGNRRVHYWTDMGRDVMQAYVCCVV